MGGGVFSETTTLNFDRTVFYNTLELVKQDINSVSGVNYLLPFRLETKQTFNDIDIILHYLDIIKISAKLEKQFVHKKIFLGEKRFQENKELKGMFSFHYIKNNIQIDLLPSIDLDFTRAYYSYNFSNVFFKKMVTISNSNCKLTSFGLFVSNEKMFKEINPKVFFKLNGGFLIPDLNLLFEMLDLNLEKFKLGFSDASVFLKYLRTSKLYPFVLFNNNSGFKHDISRLESFREISEQLKMQ